MGTYKPLEIDLEERGEEEDDPEERTDDESQPEDPHFSVALL